MEVLIREVALTTRVLEKHVYPTHTLMTPVSVQETTEGDGNVHE